MHLNADFTQSALVRPQDGQWIPSPSAGVERWMLDRVGDEVARATSLVRYAPDSHFPRHTHAGGEEYLVLDGIFSDESGDYGPGHYVRNPVGTAHAPFTKAGATILVKLWQFQAGDDQPVSTDTKNAPFQAGQTPGVSSLSLHGYGEEKVSLIRFAPGTSVPRHDHPGGEEIYVIEGDLVDEHGTYPQGSWLRRPHASRQGHKTQGGCLLFVKSGHLFPDAATLADPSQR